MNNLDLNFDGIYDSTGYLFSFAKCLAAAVKNSQYADFSEDIIASSGFAFRMWVDGKTLCPSATSIWSFDDQKSWAENGGLLCDYVGRYWGQDDIEEERRLEAIDMIKRSVNNGIAAIAWDISGCEWGLLTGYDEEQKLLNTLKINGEKGTVSYDALGKLEIPILSVLTIKGISNKPNEQILTDTMKLAVSHYKGEEWCENFQGLNAYQPFISFINDKINEESCWTLEYYLGTYGALKYYAWKFFEKYEKPELAKLYKTVYEAWLSAYEIKKSKDITDKAMKDQIISSLSKAYEAEKEACDRMISLCDNK